MSTKQHVLEVYEPYDYHGVNPMHVAGLSVLAGPMRDNYYLVRLEHPLLVGGDNVEHLLVQPRYNGDKIDRAVTSTCTVNIARVHNGADPESTVQLAFSDFERWGVGKISLSH
jgi:hypothetical protein